MCENREAIQSVLMKNSLTFNRLVMSSSCPYYDHHHCRHDTRAGDDRGVRAGGQAAGQQCGRREGTEVEGRPGHPVALLQRQQDTEGGGVCLTVHAGDGGHVVLRLHGTPAQRHEESLAEARRCAEGGLRCVNDRSHNVVHKIDGRCLALFPVSFPQVLKILTTIDKLLPFRVFSTGNLTYLFNSVEQVIQRRLQIKDVSIYWSRAAWSSRVSFQYSRMDLLQLMMDHNKEVEKMDASQLTHPLLWQVRDVQATHVLHHPHVDPPPGHPGQGQGGDTDSGGRQEELQPPYVHMCHRRTTTTLCTYVPQKDYNHPMYICATEGLQPPYVHMCHRMATTILCTYVPQKEISYDDLKEFHLMDRVLSETLRLHPPTLTSITRASDEDFEVLGKTIPKEVGVMVPLGVLHLSSKYWKEPLVFDPDRFSPDQKVDPLVYMPFGAGPRFCIGKKMALTVTKLALARLLRRYRVLPGPHTDKVPSFLPSNLLVFLMSAPECELEVEVTKTQGVGSSILRAAEEDYKVLGKTIPKNISFMVPLAVMNLSSKYWKEPLVFDPDRFSPDQKVDPLVYMPFGAGPRFCIGKKMALTVNKLALARLLRRYRVLPGPHTDQVPSFQLADLHLNSSLVVSSGAYNISAGEPLQEGHSLHPSPQEWHSRQAGQSLAQRHPWISIATNSRHNFVPRKSHCCS
ncbi:CYP3A4 [Cordylochernes scorpioides]|uniref:CYP3A4 n=1 Tax=Cordylochernes scorpioides TaxID=51811 RepID=A0ABY6KI31_9ARAC|nr:CYP3A4 [Cordylochernes scorpioides]